MVFFSEFYDTNRIKVARFPTARACGGTGNETIFNAKDPGLILT